MAYRTQPSPLICSANQSTGFYDSLLRLTRVKGVLKRILTAMFTWENKEISQTAIFTNPCATAFALFLGHNTMKKGKVVSRVFWSAKFMVTNWFRQVTAFLRFPTTIMHNDNENI